MATRAEIIAAAHAGRQRVDEVFGALSDAQLGMPVQSGGDGWTVRDVLAHLASIGGAHDMLIGRAERGGALDPGGFDVNSSNAAQLAARAGHSRDELLDECRAAHERLIGRVERLSDDQLAATVQTIRGPMTLGDLLMHAGSRHTMAHADEVAAALARSKG